MSPKAIRAACLAAAFAFSGLMNSAPAQTPAATDAAKAPAQDKVTNQDKATEKKTKAEARKAAAAERKAKAAERKAQAQAVRKAAHERQKQCGAEWKKVRAESKIEKGMTWPKYYSACNKRLKEKAA